jgi:hypothetical protein
MKAAFSAIISSRKPVALGSISYGFSKDQKDYWITVVKGQASNTLACQVRDARMKVLKKGII